ncbi:DNA-binding MarR family transcriptional regulator [Streptosporangium becharense]|uniref:DNA-binding MarR family transcriptional regulator n=1 Tax=Streptosporangium becharense TaxID=1816182 RepID=A0A7W9MIT4_9ACTN|nr:MarR family transcriptional regulator [Streptosporangium becharense]MBB2911079.1 DNA-binding MarR family transcriptional regulator [Streptosporangium becharense]MBB5821863.1 DNA-binding MarR family transcriptional regulator [Streptosporangium becharense]
MTAGAGEPLHRHSSLGYQVNHLGRLLAQALRARTAPHGVVPGQFAQLLALYEQDGLTQNQLCERVRIDQSTMAHTLQRMQRDGLVERAADPADRRRVLITLTGRARELESDLVRAAGEVNAVVTRGLTEEEVTGFMLTLSRLIENLEADSAGGVQS